MTPFRRAGGRDAEVLRELGIVPDVAPYAEGSALIKLGQTHVLCTASVEERVPRWMVGKGRGWVTAEYSMLPRATRERTQREATAGKQTGRTVEIQRLIGRSLRAVVDLNALGERQVIVDCDVLQADGGTRCAAISGGYVALALAMRRLQVRQRIKQSPLKSAVAAVSVGVVRGVTMLDLDYNEDPIADVDCNIVMTNKQEYVEVQGTAEGSPFSPAVLEEMLILAGLGLESIFTAQDAAIAAASTKR